MEKTMKACLLKQTLKAHFDLIFLQNAPAAAQNTAPVQQPERNEAEIAQRTANTGQQFRTSFRQQIADLDVAAAGETLKQIDEVENSIPANEKALFKGLLESAKQFKERRDKVLSALKTVGTAGLDPSTVSRALSEARSIERDFLPRFAVNAQPLIPQVSGLVAAAEQAVPMQDAFNEMVQVYHSFKKKNLTESQLLYAWGSIEKKLREVYSKLANLPSAYSQLPFVATNILEQKLSSEKGEGEKGASFNDLAEFASFARIVNALSQVQGRVKNMSDLKNQIAKDYNMSLEEVNNGLKKGARFEMESKTYIVAGISGDSIIMEPTAKQSASDFYMAMLLESGLGKKKQEAKLEGKFVPAIDSLDDLYAALKLKKEQQPLNSNAIIQTPKAYDMAITHVDHKKGKIHVKVSTNKVSVMDFSAFYDFWKEKKLIYKKKGVHPFSRTYLAKDPAAPPSKLPRLVSFAAMVQGFTRIKEFVDRKTKARTSIDASNFSKLLAQGVVSKIPWMGDVANIAVTANSSFIIGEIEKLVSEYKNITDGELKDLMKQFNKRNKLEQVALIAIAVKKGASRQDIAVKLYPDKYKKKRVTHPEYVSALIQYFCRGPGALPDKIEALISDNFADAIQKEIDAGNNETKEYANTEDILSSQHAFAGFDSDKPNWTKKYRVFGAFKSMVAFGCDAPQFGRGVMMHFKHVTASTKPGEFNHFDDKALRYVGNRLRGYGIMGILLRVPYGIALARSMIDFYITKVKPSTNDDNYDPFNADQYPEDADILGKLFAGRWELAEKDLKGKLGEKDFQTMKYLFTKAKMFAVKLGGKINLNLADMDESLTNDVHGVSGMLTQGYLVDLLEITTNEAKPKNLKKIENWLENLDKSFKEAPSDDQYIFAINFAKALSSFPPEGQSWYWQNHADKLRAVFSKLAKGKMVVTIGNAGNTTDIECNSLEEVAGKDVTIKDNNGNNRIVHVDLQNVQRVLILDHEHIYKETYKNVSETARYLFDTALETQKYGFDVGNMDINVDEIIPKIIKEAKEVDSLQAEIKERLKNGTKISKAEEKQIEAILSD